MSTDYFRLDRPVAASKADGFTPKTQILFFLVAVLIVISRRPDTILYPQFFAEDGMFWFADAYNTGWWHSLLIAHTGYFQTLPRLAAALALLVPLKFAPLLLNLTAIAIQVLPATLITSARCRFWAPLNARILMAVAYLAIPNSRELDATITEAQWHMALLAALVLLAAPSASRLWRLFDLGVVLLSGLTGPFCLALLPVAAVIWWRYRRTWHAMLIGLLAVTGAIQLYALATTAVATRSQAVLGATVKLFLQMLAGDVYAGAIVGQNNLASRAPTALLLLLALAGSALLVYCFLKTTLELRLFLVYCFLLYIASLRNPMISLDKPQWQVLRDAPGLRYWFFPMLGFAWAAIWCAISAPEKAVRRVAGIALCFMIFGVAKDWIYPAFLNNNYPDYVKKFDALPPGEAMLFPLYPNGWTMQLVRKGKSCPSLPTGFVDTPKDNEIAGSALLVRGWVVSSQPGTRIEILVDGVRNDSSVSSVSRPDVDKLYPDSRVKEKGWQTTLKLHVPPGSHRIQVNARNPDGCAAVLGNVSVQAGAAN